MRLFDKINAWIEAKEHKADTKSEEKELRRLLWGVALVFSALITVLAEKGRGFNSYWEFAGMFFLFWIFSCVVMLIVLCISQWISVKRPIARYFLSVLAFFALSYAAWAWGYRLF